VQLRWRIILCLLIYMFSCSRTICWKNNLSSTFALVFFSVLGISQGLVHSGKCCAPWAIPPSLCLYFVVEIGLLTLLGLASSYDPSVSVSLVAGITGVHPLIQPHFKIFCQKSVYHIYVSLFLYLSLCQYYTVLIILFICKS
jgi:hypothetical protein